jgi:hypothetical protein
MEGVNGNLINVKYLKKGINSFILANQRFFKNVIAFYTGEDSPN